MRLAERATEERAGLLSPPSLHAQHTVLLYATGGISGASLEAQRRYSRCNGTTGGANLAAPMWPASRRTEGGLRPFAGFQR